MAAPMPPLPQDEKRKEWLDGLCKDPVIEEALRILDDMQATPAPL